MRRLWAIQQMQQAGGRRAGQAAGRRRGGASAQASVSGNAAPPAPHNPPAAAAADPTVPSPPAALPAAPGQVVSTDPSKTPSCTAQGTSWTVDLHYSTQLSQVRVHACLVRRPEPALPVPLERMVWCRLRRSRPSAAGMKGVAHACAAWCRRFACVRGRHGARHSCSPRSRSPRLAWPRLAAPPWHLQVVIEAGPDGVQGGSISLSDSLSEGGSSCASGLDVKPSGSAGIQAAAVACSATGRYLTLTASASMSLCR